MGNCVAQRKEAVVFKFDKKEDELLNETFAMYIDKHQEYCHLKIAQEPGGVAA